MSFYQFFLATIAFFFLITGIIKFSKRQRNQTFFKLFVTVSIWGSIFIFSIFPKLSYTISETFGLGKSLNTLIFTGFVVVFIIIFRLLNIIERLERNISEIVRKKALEKIDTSSLF